MRLSPFKMLDWHMVLQIDAMYFRAARLAHEKAIASVHAIKRAEDRLASHQERMDAIDDMATEGRISESEHYSMIEPLVIQMEGLEYGVGSAHGVLLGNVGPVHILCSAALESHINIRAESFFTSRRILDAFERLSLDAKWLMFPRIRGLSGFDTGREPFQGFDRLVKFRNRLVHYKTRREAWKGAAVPPDFLRDLGLTTDDSAHSLDAVKGMTTELARQLGESAPWWVERESTNFFKLETKHSRGKVA